MSDRVRRRLFQRVAVWEPKSGTILDLPTRYVLAFDGPEESEEYAQLTSGSKRPVRRTHSVQIPLTAREVALMGEIIHRTKCPVKAAFIGPKDADNWLWLEPTRLNITDPSIPAGQQAEKVIDLESTVFYPGIWEGEDLLAGVPWQGTEDWKDPDTGQVLFRPEGNVRAGYEGPLWSLAAQEATGRTIALDGSPSGISSTSPAIIRIQFPFWGARLRLEAPPGYQISDGVIRAYGWGNAVLASAQVSGGATLDLPDDTWNVEVEIRSAEARPRLRVERAGDDDPRVLVGETTPDCSRVTDPGWTELPNPNEPPFWRTKETVVWEPNNIAPTWEDREDLEFVTTPSAANSAPTWEDREDLQFQKEQGAVFGVEDTQSVFTHIGGLLGFTYPTASEVSQFSDDVADGQAKVDHERDYVFVARDGQITRLQFTPTSPPAPLTVQILDTGSDNVRGLAIDPSTRTVYFTYESRPGLYETDYDGQSGENEVVSGLSADEWYLDVDPLDRRGLIFCVSGQANGGAGEIRRYALDGSGLVTLVDGTNYTLDVYPEIALSRTHEKVVFELEAPSEKQLLSLNYDGSGEANIVHTFGDGPLPPHRFSVADAEGVVVTCTQVEGGFASVDYYGMFVGDPAPNDLNLNGVDTGERVTVSFAYSTSGNNDPEWENRENLEYAK